MSPKGRGAVMRGSKYHEAWYEPRHAELFDGWSKLSSRRLRKVYESFNEIRLLIENQRSINGEEFVEVGCATGELYRYLRYYFPKLKYSGFDISQPATYRAK